MRQSIIIFRGLPGTGKTFLIKNLVQRIDNIVIISRDVVRLKVFKNPSYSKEEKEQLLSVMLFMAEENILAKKTVIIDGMTFATRDSIKPFRNLADKHNINFKIIECFCSEETSLSRIEKDIIENNHPAADRDDELYYHVKEYFEVLDEYCLKINTEDNFEENLEKIIFFLNSKVLKIQNAN